MIQEAPHSSHELLLLLSASPPPVGDASEDGDVRPPLLLPRALLPLPVAILPLPALRKYVDAAARARLFDEAVRGLNRNIPVDVILLPMKGDVPAPHRFWGLARMTKGAFVMPSPDWP